MADIQGLIQHLRSQTNPGSADAAALAQQFGVDEALVRNAMQTLSRNAPRPEPKRRTVEGAPKIASFIRWTSEKPGLAIGSCGLLILVCMLLSEYLIGPAVFVFLILALLVLIAGLVIAALSRRARFGALAGPALMGAVAIEILITDQGKTQPTTWIGIALLAVMISAFGVLAAIVGGFVWLKRQQKLDRATTRQQMLDRLMQVRLALEYPRTTPQPTRWRSIVENARKSFWWTSLGVAVFMAGVQTFVLRVLSVSPELLSGEVSRRATMKPEEMTAAVVLATIGVGQFMLMVLIGYLGKSFWRTCLSIVIYQAVSFIPGFLGWNKIAIARLQTMPVGHIISSYVALLLCAVVGVAAAAIEEYTVRARLRQENDPDALLAELLDLEIALGGGLQDSYVLVVDVAGSTAMKKDADPLVAEWTFRAYQEVVSRVGGQHLGSVESTAGDGAVLAFPSANHALAAARDLLAALPDFNASTNRLGEPFVLRIGLHCGEVRGDLNEVQFTRVIDVAAHVEAASPRNGIAMTAPFRDKLTPVPTLEKMAVSVDGFDVYVAL